MPVKSKYENYTNEELLEIMKLQYEKNPNSTCADFKDKNGLPNNNVYVKRFGSYRNALVLSGVRSRSEVRKLSKEIKKEDIIKQMKLYYEEFEKIPVFYEFVNYSNYSRDNIVYWFGKDDFYNKLITESGLEQRKTAAGVKANKDILIWEIQRFVKEFNRVPVQADFEKLKGYPSRKTFTNYFDTFNDAIRSAGFTPTSMSLKEKNEFYNNPNTRTMLLDYVRTVAKELGKTPTCKDLEGMEYNRNEFRKIFGTYNKALIEAGLELNSVSQYEDSFLENEFHRFVQENGRTPYLHEFNTSGYPSFWCYQQRFGSWDKAVIAYGYEPNDMNRKFYLEGEMCCSSYEFDVSKWLKANQYKYKREVRYDTFIDSYNGKMDCDYVIELNDELVYLEVAGLLPRYGLKFDKWSDIEKNYFFKMKYKEKMLKENNLKYIILKPYRFKNNTWIEKLEENLK